jgi:hypothetical protein
VVRDVAGILPVSLLFKVERADLSDDLLCIPAVIKILQPTGERILLALAAGSFVQGLAGWKFARVSFAHLEYVNNWEFTDCVSI